MLATLGSLHKKQEIQKLNYIDHPSILNELIKFIAVNTKFQLVKELKETSVEHTKAVNELNMMSQGTQRW